VLTVIVPKPKLVTTHGRHTHARKRSVAFARKARSSEAVKWPPPSSRQAHWRSSGW